MQKFTGQFTRFIFRNEDTNFYVALFKAEKTDELDAHTLSVSANQVFEIGLKYEITVTKRTTGKYANTYILDTLQEILPDTTKGIVNYLSSNKFPKIGKKIAQLIVEKFGVETIEKIKEDPTILDDKEFKLSASKKQTIIDGINSQDNENKLILLFQTNGLSPVTLKKIITTSTIGVKLFWDKYSYNPYYLWIENEIFNFNEVNELARALNFDDAKRVKYIILDILFNSLWDLGSTKVSLSYLFKIINQVYPINKEEYGAVLKDLIEENLVKAFNMYITPTKFYDKENFIVNYLKKLSKKEKTLFETKEIDNYFDPIQKEAILGGLTERISIITGQPGTGKTEILKAILKQLSTVFSLHQIAILAPTGRAAYQITEKSGYNAKTIHSFLGWKVTHFDINSSNQVETKILIVDEFSMVDTKLFYALLSGINSKTIEKIILIGDKDQIPSIGEGYLLNDLIDSQQFNVFRLQNNYRQVEGSNIFSDATLINNGEMPIMEYPDCYLIESNNETFKKDLEKTFNKFYKKYPIEDITILAPMYEGVTGIHWINSFIQNKIFSKKEQIPININNKKYFIGDKVIQLENDINANVFNGEIGYIDNVIFYKEKIDFIIVRFPNEKLVKYTLAQWNTNISLAYAISIHKFQGSESPIVIMILFQAHSVLLNKKLLYTGVTRAKNNLVLIGEKNAIEKATKNDTESARLTNLQDLLK